MKRLLSLVTDPLEPDDPRKGWGNGWAKWIMYKHGEPKASKLYTVIMCGFACNAVTRLTQERSKEKHHEERTTAFGANRGIERNAEPFY